jgi:hypothetical protein
MYLPTRQAVQDRGSPSSIRRADIDEMSSASEATAGTIEQFNEFSISARRYIS